jgi:uncharacterized membrane protein (DUF2068 family)
MTPANRAGVVTFAGVLFIVVGVFTAFDGIIAMARPEQLFVGENAFVVKDYDAVGVTLLVLGCVEVLVGIGILNRARIAQFLGIALASLAFLIHLAYFRHYPAWSVVLMALNLIVIYALTVHNDQFRGARRRR